MKKILVGLFLCLSLGSALAADIRPGQSAPDFQLTNLNNESVKLSQFKGKFVVLEWFNKDCPFVKKHYSSMNMPTLQKHFTEKGVVWLTINSSAKGKQENESATEAQKTLKTLDAYSSHYLVDEKGVVARAYNAKTTPQMFVINPEQKVLYAGAIDSIPSTEANDIETARNYVREALDLAMNGKEVAHKVSTPYGCAVKL